jgi:putative SOS response-associated peptidase YedK
MCRKYIIGSSLETIRTRFNVESPSIKDWNTGQFISPGDEALIITQENPKEIILSNFGMIPAWSKRPLPIINARTEGDKNPENNPSFRGSKAIFRNPAFQKPIFFHRCLVIADAFVEWSIGGNQDPYVVYLRNQERPFTMAGLYDIWVNPATSEKHHSFTIITVPGNTLLYKLPYTRMPVILEKGRENRWLKPDLSLNQTLSQLKIHPSNLMNAYPVSSLINHNNEDVKKRLQPIGERLLDENKQFIPPKLSRNSYHNSLNRHAPDETKPSWAERKIEERSKEI